MRPRRALIEQATERGPLQRELTRQRVAQHELARRLGLTERAAQSYLWGYNAAPMTFLDDAAVALGHASFAALVAADAARGGA